MRCLPQSACSDGRRGGRESSLSSRSATTLFALRESRHPHGAYDEGQAGLAHYRRRSRLGVDIARAALAAGSAVVATGRDPAKVAAAVGTHDNLLAVKLDVTSPQEAQAAVESAVEHFGRIDILVNNAGNFFAGFFEELSPAQVRNQIETLLFGPMNVTRAALPVMRNSARARAHYFLDRRHLRTTVLHGICCREVWDRRVDGVAHA